MVSLTVHVYATLTNMVVWMQSLLRAGSDLSVEALVQFVKAFVTSPFCLEPLEEVAERLKHTLDLVMHSHVKQHGHQPWPHVW